MMQLAMLCVCSAGGVSWWPFHGYQRCIGLYLVHGSMAVQVAIHQYLTGWVRYTDLKCDTNINKTKTLKHRSNCKK